MSDDQTRRRRGRPIGSGINDTVDLLAVADEILRSGVKPTTAMKRCIKHISDAHLRRLQVKWRDNGETLLSQARDRQEAQRRQEIQRSRPSRNPASPEAALHATRRLHEVIESMGSLQRLCNDIANPPYLESLRRLEDLLNPPALRRLQAMFDPPMFLGIRKLYDPPIVRATDFFPRAPTATELHSPYLNRRRD